MHFLTRLFSVLLAIASFWLIAKPVKAQNLVNNPGFETGNFTGWTVVSPNNDLQVKLATSNLPAHSGTHYANFGDRFAYGTLSQTLPTVSGQQYTLDYFLANYGSGSLETPNGFRVTVGGNELFNQVNLPYQPFYQAYTFSFAATGPSTVLDFTGYDTPFALFLDDVSVSGSTITNAPEPGTFALLMAGGLFTVTLLCRCCRKKSYFLK